MGLPREARKIASVIAGFVCLMVVGCAFSQEVRTVKAEGSTMSPAIKDGDMLKLDTSFYSSGAKVERFDIVSFLLSEEQKRFLGLSGDLFYTKRVIGLPNEKFEIKNGKVLINDSPLDEPFEKEMREVDDFGPIMIPDNAYFVLGDNRPNSADGRIWQPATIKEKDILGKIVEVVPAKK